MRDNGIGIPPAQRQRVFDTFHRVSEEGYSGTGLGLAICKRIVQRHGGTIWVDAQPRRRRQQLRVHPADQPTRPLVDHDLVTHPATP